MGAHEPLGSNFFQNHQYSVLLPISCKIFTWNDILKFFPIQTHWRPMLTLPLNRSRPSQGRDLYIHCSAWAIDASCQVWLKSVHWFWRIRFLKGFYHIWAWRPSWSCDLDCLYTHWFPLPIDASHKIWLWLAKRFQRRWCLNIMVMYRYIAPGWGHMSPWGQIFFRINIQSYCPFPARFSEMTF